MKAQTINENKLIMVCSECKMACCWYGEFMCDDARDADTECISVLELRKLATGESEKNWSDKYMEKIYGEPAPFGYK